jgi:hypothetical protein
MRTTLVALRGLPTARAADDGGDVENGVFLAVCYVRHSTLEGLVGRRTRGLLGKMLRLKVLSSHKDLHSS